MQKRTYGLPLYEADILCTERELADYFEACVLVSENLFLLALWHITQLDEKDIPKGIEKYPALFVETFRDFVPTPTQVAKFILNEMKAQAKKFKKEVWEIPCQLTAMLLLMRRASKMNNKDIQAFMAKEYAHVDESAF